MVLNCDSCEVSVRTMSKHAFSRLAYLFGSVRACLPLIVFASVCLCLLTFGLFFAFFTCVCHCFCLWSLRFACRFALFWLLLSLFCLCLLAFGFVCFSFFVPLCLLFCLLVCTFCFRLLSVFFVFVSACVCSYRMPYF